MERFNLKKLKQGRGQREGLAVSNTYAALEDLNTEVEINSAWEMIGENIKISAKESLGYFELKKHKLWFEKECSYDSVGSIIQYSHRVCGIHESSQDDSNVFK
jgi:hypothetical protein